MSLEDGSTSNYSGMNWVVKIWEGGGGTVDRSGEGTLARGHTTLTIVHTLLVTDYNIAILYEILYVTHH